MAKRYTASANDMGNVFIRTANLLEADIPTLSKLSLSPSYTAAKARDRANRAERASEYVDRQWAHLKEKGAPRGPYVEPKFRPVEPRVPYDDIVHYKGENVEINKAIDGSDSIVGPYITDKKGRYSTKGIRVIRGAGRSFTDENGIKHNLRELMPPVKPKSNSEQARQNYAKAYLNYLQQKSLFDKKEGPFWDRYRQQVADFNKRHEAWQSRVAKRDARIQATLNAKAARKQQKVKPNIMAGYSPWSDKYGEFKRLNVKQLKELGANYNEIKSPNKKIIHLADGTTAEVIDSNLGVPLGFSQSYGYNGASETVEEGNISSYDYAVKAFDGKHKTSSSDGCGHIKHVEYSATFQLLKVVFWNDTTCIYYRVPASVAGELLHFAETKQESTNTFDGSQRHVLGIRFWDLVRIRGTLHGARYRFEYLNYTSGTGNPRGRPEGSGQYIWDKEWLPMNDYTTANGLSAAKLLSTMAVHDNKALNDVYDEDTNQLSGIHGTEAVTNGSLDLSTRHSRRKIDTKKNYTESIYKGQFTENDLDNYFDTYYNRDLARKSVNRQMLLKAHDKYNDVDYKDASEVAKLILQAGAYIKANDEE